MPEILPKIPRPPLFDPGHILATPGALQVLHEHNTAARDLLFRHLTGDWGDLCDEDRQLNDQALKTGARLVSAYHLGTDKLWVITEGAGDRRMTTILRPDEY